MKVMEAGDPTGHFPPVGYSSCCWSTNPEWKSTEYNKRTHRGYKTEFMLLVLANNFDIHKPSFVLLFKRFESVHLCYVLDPSGL